MDERLTKRQVREALGFKRDAQLAAFFRVTKQAVSRWPEDGPLPLQRQWQMQAYLAGFFGAWREAWAGAVSGVRDKDAVINGDNPAGAVEHVVTAQHADGIENRLRHISMLPSPDLHDYVREGEL